MALQDDLFAIEQGFWLDGEDFFLAHVDEQCLLAFPQMGEFHGVFPRERVAATATQENRWRDLEMHDRSLLELGTDAAVISYRAEVTRHDGEPYPALVSSAYRRRDDSWKLPSTSIRRSRNRSRCPSSPSRHSALGRAPRHS